MMLAMRRGMVRAFAEAYPETVGKNLDLLTCTDLDARRVDVRFEWRRDYNIDTWEEGYSHPKVKQLIKKMFSDDRRGNP